MVFPWVDRDPWTDSQKQIPHQRSRGRSKREKKHLEHTPHKQQTLGSHPSRVPWRRLLCSKFRHLNLDRRKKRCEKPQQWKNSFSNSFSNSFQNKMMSHFVIVLLDRSDGQVDHTGAAHRRRTAGPVQVFMAGVAVASKGRVVMRAQLHRRSRKPSHIDLQERKKSKIYRRVFTRKTRNFFPTYFIVPGHGLHRIERMTGNGMSQTGTRGLQDVRDQVHIHSGIMARPMATLTHAKSIAQSINPSINQSINQSKWSQSIPSINSFSSKHGWSTV